MKLIACEHCRKKFGRKNLRLIVLNDYEENGGWLWHKLLCEKCIDILDDF